METLSPEEQEQVSRLAEDMGEDELAEALESMAEREAALLGDPRLPEGSDERRLSLHYLAALVAARSSLSYPGSGPPPEGGTSPDPPGSPPSPE